VPLPNLVVCDHDVQSLRNYRGSEGIVERFAVLGPKADRVALVFLACRCHVGRNEREVPFQEAAGLSMQESAQEEGVAELFREA